jgi:hypothetical protein
MLHVMVEVMLEKQQLLIDDQKYMVISIPSQEQ